MVVKKGLKLRQLGNEYILIGEGLEAIDFNKMITMNETAAYLWEKVCDGREINAEKLAELLMEEYEVEHEQAVSDCQETIIAWTNAGIIE